MVEYENANLDNVLHALSNSTRRNIVLQLTKRDLTVNELAEKYEMSLQAVSKHIQVLVKSGLVVKHKSGRERLCRVSYGPLESVSDLLDEYRRFWEARMDSLEKYFENQKTGVTSMSEAVVIVKRVIKACPELVFEAFTKPGIMSRWFYGMENGTSEVSNTLEVGGGFSINMRSPDGKEYMHTGEYRDIRPNERLVFTWNSDYAQDTVVTVSFRPVPDGTEVTIEHEFLEVSERDPHRRGWTLCVNNLEKVFA